ncbi:unnamed protein product [Boreogadus saida]
MEVVQEAQLWQTSAGDCWLVGLVFVRWISGDGSRLCTFNTKQIDKEGDGYKDQAFLNDSNSLHNKSPPQPDLDHVQGTPAVHDNTFKNL